MAANNTYKNWTTDEDNILRKVIQESISYEDLCKKYFSDRTASSLQSRARRLQLDNNFEYRKNFFDESFWDTPNLLNSFWAGTMAADGSIRKMDNIAQSLNWEIAVMDEKYLDKFVENCKFTGNKHYWKKTNNSGTFSYTVKVCIHSRRWVKKLGENFNVTPNKANRISIPENFSHELKMAWLIGYINGDGCVHLSKKIFYQNQWQEKFSIGFTSASHDIIKWICDFSNKKFLPKRRAKSQRFRKMRTTQGINPYYHITISGQPAIQMFIYLSQFDVPLLERKWRDGRILNHIKEEYLKNPEDYKDYIWNNESFIVNFLKNN